MKTATDIFLTAVLVLSTAWVVIFGIAGSVICKKSGVTGPAGAVIGAIFGPLGLIYLVTKKPKDVSVPMISKSNFSQNIDDPSFDL